MTLQEACDQIGIEYKYTPVDGKLRPTAVIGKGSKNTAGRIKLFADGTGGIVMNNIDATVLTFWTEDAPSRMAESDKTARTERVAREKQELEESGRICREESKHLWENVTQDTVPAEHAYLVAKGIKPYGIKYQSSGELLVIPVMSVDRVLHGLQFISGDTSKKFKTSTLKTGHFHKIIGNNQIIICEGFATGASIHEATGATVVVAFDAGNLLPVASAIRSKAPNHSITIASDNDIDTAGNPGVTKATKAAQEIGALITIADFTDEQVASFRISNGGKPPTDFNDLHKIAGLAAVKLQVGAAAMVESMPTHAPDAVTFTETATKNDTDPLSEAVNRLAKLSPLEYDKVRKEEAKNLGVRPGTLDAAVKSARKEESSESDFEEVEPWPEPVDGAELLTTIAATVRRFIICEPHTAQSVALWVAMTWFIEVIQVAPLAVITAPEKRCGKSMMLFLIGRLVSRPLMSSSISPSALFRSIDAWQPTLLIDEVDACLKDNEELRGLLNCGHTRDTAFTIRCVGDDHTPKRFNVWGAKALSGIGHVADTLMDRSIILELRRKLSHETVDRIRHAESGLFSELCSKLARFADDNRERVRLARPDLPPSLNDRAQDNWEPLLAIATVAGGDWFKIGTAAALKLSGGESLSLSIGTELLADIQEIFEHKKVDRIPSAELIKELCSDDEKPWATYNKGFQIKPRQLAGRLKGYGIHSKTIRIGFGETPKGYEVSQFKEAFSRYIPLTPPISATTPQISIQAVLPVADDPQRCGYVADVKTRKPASIQGCGVVADTDHFSASEVIDLTGIDFEVIG